MKIYVVGGAVRDALLGLPVKDRDHVVVGATPEAMVARGFTPVGKDFPVFLHPKTHEEYALARTERKTAPGYKGFHFHADPGITLEQDLARRDLTINAIAQAEDGSLIDPYGGQRDLQAKVFRHVSDAFIEDPVRILRLARFAARFADFSVAPETMALMQRMVQAGEVDALVPERVWQEVARGLMGSRPSRMFFILRECGALSRIVPELNVLWAKAGDASSGEQAMQAMQAVDIAAKKEHALPIRVAVLMPGLSATTKKGGQADIDVSAVESVCRRLRAPNDCRDLAVMTAREQEQVMQALALPPETLVDLFQRCDAYRKPQRFIDMLCAMECVHAAANHDAAFPQSAHLETRLNAALQVRTGDIAAQVVQRYPGEPQRIAAAVRKARIAAISSV
jgi:tRNA nucleotidyltransferase (CCA-adding enzyme)